MLEEQHGFNKTTLSLYFIDIIKGWALGIVLGGPLLALFLHIFEWAGDRFVPWVMMLMYVLDVSQALCSRLNPFFPVLSSNFRW